MKKKGLLAVCLSSLLVISACGNNADVAETSKGAVTQEEFYQALKDAAGASVLKSLVYEKILSATYDVTEKAEAKMKEYEAQYGDQLETLVQQQLNMPDLEAFKKQLTVDLMIQEYATSKVEITDEELQQAYDEYEPEIRASHILIGTDVKNAKKKAENLKKQLDGGADFATLAKENSTDPGSAANGGDLGFFGKGRMVAEFENAAFKLKAGEISDVIKSEFGYHIIQVTEKPKKESLENMKDELREQIATSKLTSDMLSQYLQELVDESSVKVLDQDLKDVFSTGKETSDTETKTDTSTDNTEENK